MGNNNGACVADWTHFHNVLGLGQDLLPVVSNLSALISEKSAIKELGKTPSVYNRNGKVIGFKDWTNKRTTNNEIAEWSKVSDYGICLQTRLARAIDIDAVDEFEAEMIEDAVTKELGFALPARRRPNSAKRLLVFKLEAEDFPKRKFTVDSGIVEILGNGQQFIAIGTHPSGVVYEWHDGLPVVLPVLSIEQFERLWSVLVDMFAVGDVVVSNGAERKKGVTVVKDDPVAKWLRDGDKVVEEDDEKITLVCPWDELHTTGNTGDGSTVWFLAGSNGYDAGHFNCFHGHCEGRTDSDFFDAIGFEHDVQADFELIESVADEVRLPNFKRDKKGKIEATIENVCKALMSCHFAGIKIRFDEFKDEIVYSPCDCEEWVTFRDENYVEIRINLAAKGFKPVGRELIRDAVLFVASENKFDSAIEWINRLEWDGVPRINNFMTDYMGAIETYYAESVGSYLWTALAGRVLSPGIKADMSPIFVGNQGAGKSTAVAAIVPDIEFFTEVSLIGEKDADLSRKMRGSLVAEIGELRGLNSRDIESIKAFITRTHEEWTPKFKEFNTKFPRRLVFIGTTNQDQFLADETGNRRWLPIKIGQSGKVDVAAIVRDRLQLWAEGKARFLANGIEYKEAENLGVEVHGQHMISDIWETVVDNWLHEPDLLTGEKPIDSPFLTSHEVLVSALKFDDKHINRKEQIRVGNILKALGFDNKLVRKGGKVLRAWAKIDFEADL